MSAIQSEKRRVTVANGVTTYVEIGDQRSWIKSVQLSWPDATSNAAVTLETTNFSPDDADGQVAAGAFWFPETGVTIAGPTGASAGCTMVHMGNIGSKRARLKIVASAATTLDILPHGKG